MNDLTEREIEIAALREQMGLTFKAIGARCHISTSRAAQLYRRVRRKRRQAQGRAEGHGPGREPPGANL